MQTIWFILVAVMLAGYVLLDGFDLGAGAIHLIAARLDPERRAILASIGPVWDGNEVWLLAAGGTLYFAFPALYAAGFSGFYLALMIVLWLLMLRGLSIELRGHVDSPLWRSFWDATFSVSSILLAVFYGAALGNVVRGVPLNKDGYFFLPLWTNLLPGPNPGIIDWYTVLTGIAALLVLTVHGALWVMLRTSGDPEERSRRIATTLYPAVWGIVIAITAASFAVQPRLSQSFSARPWEWVFPLITLAGLIGIRVALSRNAELTAFLSSCVFIAGLLLSAAFGLYPALLPAVPDAGMSLTIANSAAPDYGLGIGFLWWIPAFLLAAGYTAFIYRHFRGKIVSQSH